VLVASIGLLQLQNIQRSSKEYRGSQDIACLVNKWSNLDPISKIFLQKIILSFENNSS
jgi:hypothetical protein